MKDVKSLIEVVVIIIKWWKEIWAYPSTCILVAFVVIFSIANGRIPSIDRILYVSAYTIFLPFLFLACCVISFLLHSLVVFVSYIPIWVIKKIFKLD